MFEHDAELKARALDLWANHIETGDLTLSATDARERNTPERLRTLDEGQQRRVERLRRLAREELAR